MSDQRSGLQRINWVGFFGESISLVRLLESYIPRQAGLKQLSHKEMNKIQQKINYQTYSN